MTDTPADAATLYEEKRGDISPFSTRPTTSNTLNGHVDVPKAEQEFNALSRQLTNKSEAARKRSKSNASSATAKDVEKAEADDRFDLREYLTSSNDTNQKAGIKHKVRTFIYFDHLFKALL